MDNPLFRFGVVALLLVALIYCGLRPQFHPNGGLRVQKMCPQDELIFAFLLAITVAVVAFWLQDAAILSF